MGLDKLERNSHKGSVFEPWLLPLSVLFVSLLLVFGGETAREWLRFERAGIIQGDAWRLLSGHFVHLGPSHFALNAVGLCLVWYLFGGTFGRLQWGLVLVIGIVCIDLGFWFLNPELQWYVGLSGLLHGALAAGLIGSAAAQRKDVMAVGLLLVAKIAWEQLSGPLPGSVESSGGAVIVDAHLYGAVAGVLAGLLLRIRVPRSGPI